MKPGQDSLKGVLLVASGTLPRLLTVEEAAEFLGLSRNNLYIAAREGRIPSFKVGSLVRFDLDELRSWLDANRRGPKAEK